MSFVNVFGGGVLQSSNVGYRAFTLSSSVSLVWPPQSQSATDFVARINDVNCTVAGQSITMPPANQVSTGQDVFFRNIGSQSFTVKDNSGNTIMTVAPGNSMLLFLTDNSTQYGTWASIIYGVGSSTLSAAQLAGMGVYAIGATLNSGHPIVITASGAVAINPATDRASLQVWSGGAGAYTLPATATAGNNFFFLIRNSGTGVLNVSTQASETIDGQSSIQLQPAESCVIVCNGSGVWYSVGRGRSTSFNFTQLVKTVTGGTVTLAQTEAANVVQKYIGTLTSNQIVVLPAVVQVYYVNNSTSGAYTLTFQSPAPGTVVNVLNGQTAILFCDGTNVINASTSISGITSLLLNQGTPTAPSIGFVGNSQTGIYQPASNQLGIAINGVLGALFAATGLTITGGITLSGSGQIYSGDFSNATYSSRAYFQTSTGNGNTGVFAVPNGTGTAASFNVASASDPGNSSVGTFGVVATSDVRITSGLSGTGTYLPLTFFTNGVEQLRVTTGGALQFSQTGARITGDFTNATISNRVIVQTSTATSGTQFGLMPNGTISSGTATAQLNLEDSTSVSTGNGAVGSIGLVQATDFRIQSTIRGTGTYLPLTFFTNGVEQLRVTTGGALQFSQTGARITGDFTNATNSSRLCFQTSTGNGNTGLFLIPNGTGTASNVNVTSAADPNNASIGTFGVVATSDVRITSGLSGTGSYLPLTFFTSGSERLRVDTSGNLLANSSATGYWQIPNGTTGQRPGSPSAGMIRYNNTTLQFEGYATAWGSLGGGATGGGSDTIFNLNGQTVTTSYSIQSGKNASSVGPITINAGATVTIPSGSRWVVL